MLSSASTRLAGAAVLLFASTVALPASTSPDAATIRERLLAAPVPFLEVSGTRSSEEVRFRARTLSGSLFVTAAGRLVYSVPARAPAGRAAVWSFAERLAGDRTPSPRGVVRSPIRISEFRGSDPSRWRRSVPAWERLDLGEIVPGVRVELRATGRNVEKLFVVRPGTDPNRIRVGVEGVERLAVDADGRLVLHTPLGAIRFSAPRAYQPADDGTRAVEVAYRVDGSSYGFDVGAYDPSRELVIDPLLASTLIGGENPNATGNYDDDIVRAIATRDGEIYLAGNTQAPDFPVTLGYDETYNGGFNDGFVTRMTEDLSTVIASTFIGSNSIDIVHAMALTADGDVLIAGQAGSGFPYTPGAYNWQAPDDPTGPGSFIARLSGDLGTLLVSAHVSPSPNVLTIEPGNGGVYYAGSTRYPDEPVTPDAWDQTCGHDGQCDPDGFGNRQYYAMAGQFSADLSTVLHLTYLDHPAIADIAIGPDGSVYLADGADSTPTGRLQRFDAALTTRLGRAPTGSTSRTYFHGVAVGDGFVIGIGTTHDEDFLPRNGSEFDTGCGSDGQCDPVGPFNVPQPDAFIARFSLDLQTVEAAAFLGGEDDDAGRAVALGPDGSIFVVGETISAAFPVAGSGVDATCGTDGQCNQNGTRRTPDGYLARISPDLTTLTYSTYIGGSGEDLPRAVALDARRAAFVGGNTDSLDFPTTPGAFDDTYNGGTSDAFVAAFDAGGILTPAGRIVGALDLPGIPLEIERAGEEIVLTWSPTCGAGNDYAVYEGMLGDPASLAPRTCSTGGATTARLVPGDAQRFYLVVAQTVDAEGSHGRDGRGTERDPGPQACLPQAIGACP